MTNYGQLLKHAANQMARGMDAYAKQFGLTGTQLSIIDYLHHHPHALQRDIETEFNIQRSTATTTLQRMERAGLISRQAAAADARQKEVHLTTKATELAAAASDYISQQQADMAAAFSADELATFTRVLSHFTQMNTEVHHGE